jgi:predicted Mrr-cat superfamily restriction endonuclease
MTAEDKILVFNQEIWKNDEKPQKKVKKKKILIFLGQEMINKSSLLVSTATLFYFAD